MTKDGKSTENRYFITSLKDVKLAAKAMRAHWSIENNLHWVLDTVFDEDYCRVRKNNSAKNPNIIRKLVTNHLKGIELPIVTRKKSLTIGNKLIPCSQNQNCPKATSPPHLKNRLRFRHRYKKFSALFYVKNTFRTSPPSGGGANCIQLAYLMKVRQFDFSSLRSKNRIDKIKT